MSNICFSVRSSVFLMECRLSEFSKNTDACNVEYINFPHITERLSLSFVASFEDWFSASFALDHSPCARMIWIFNDTSDSASV